MAKVLKMKCYSLFDPRGTWEHAGAKAPADAQQVVDELGYERVSLYRMPAMHAGFLRRIVSWLLWQFQVVLAFYRIEGRGTLFIQYPHKYMQYLNGLVKGLVVLKHVKIIVLIHDLPGHGEISDPEGYKIPPECEWMWYSYLIVHNEAMMSLMVKNGVRRDRLVNLILFDYLAADVCVSQRPHYAKSVVFAGNLECPKAAYVSCFKQIPDVTWDVYGAPWNVDLFGGANVVYHGSKPASDLPKFLRSGFGLIWDGPSGETCEGGYGAYLKINDPHKLSLFLICGIPVIIWDQAAQAEFVREHEVGIAISCLSEIPVRIGAVSESEYRRMSENALGLASRIRSGAFLREALAEALSR